MGGSLKFPSVVHVRASQRKSKHGHVGNTAFHKTNIILLGGGVEGVGKVYLKNPF